MNDLTPMPGELQRGKHRCIYLTEEQRRWFENAVCNFSIRYVSKKMGVSDKTVSKLIDKFGLRKVRGYQSATTYYKLHPELLKARNEKISQRRKKLIRRERFNIRMGLHQESNVYLSPYSLSRTDYMRRFLLRRDGYVVPRTGRFVNDDPKTFYYDEDTKRHKIMEQHMEKEGYVFKPLSSCPKGHHSGCPDDHSLREWML
jgi:transposase